MKTFKFNKSRWQGSGFTLVELLLVITLIGILTVISMGQFINAQKKARDGQRKADLGNVQRALEMYFADHDQFPAAGDINDYWGAEFSDESTIYMKLLPDDPSDDYDYCYVVSESGMAYGLFAGLENCTGGDVYTPADCVGGVEYCWAVTSPNARADEF